MSKLSRQRSLRRTGIKDGERSLRLKLRIENYTSNRYNYFVADFLAAAKKATRAEVIAAWNELKTLD